MRYTILAAAVLAATFAGTASAQVQGAERYCAQSKDGGSMRCLFRTMDQCEETVRGSQSQYGNCIENPKGGKM